MTPAWRRLMGLVRLGKWVGLVGCLLIAAAIPLSILVHACWAWGPRTALLAHGVITAKDGAPAKAGFMRAPAACCPNAWHERFGFVLPEFRPIPANDPAPIDPASRGMQCCPIPIPLHEVHPLWEFLLFVAWLTWSLWLADRSVRVGQVPRRNRRRLIRSGAAAVAFIVILLAASFLWRAWLSRDERWLCAIQKGSAYLSIAAPGVSSAAGIIPIQDEFAPYSVQFGAYRAGVRESTPIYRHGLPMMNRNYRHWWFELPLWLPALLIGAPTFCLFVRSRRPPTAAP